jgi:Ni,Fe-hydrogenase III large subunit/Ni,Fe-hydrogenase III component G
MNEFIQSILPFLPQNTKTTEFRNTVTFEIPAPEIIRMVQVLQKRLHLELKLITATDEHGDLGGFRIWYIFGVPKKNIFIIPHIRLTETLEFPSLARTIHQAWNFEKKIHSFFGLRPMGHPDIRPILLHENWPSNAFPLRKDFEWNTRPDQAHESYHFQRVKGEGIYEIPVGPVHAGIIEPGHFRFSVAGEEIMLLEPRLGYTHKGSEKLFERLSIEEKILLSEKISGDSSFSHSMAFCQAIEQLKGITLPERALYLRLIYSELERIANHFGDIGAIMLDAGFNFGGSHGSRLREMIMRINERISGSRFLRGVNCVGGVRIDLDEKIKNSLADELIRIEKDFSEVMEAAGNSDTLFNRLKGTGILTFDIAKDHGVTGIAAKAVGILKDARVDFPYAAYGKLDFDRIESEQGGDVHARFRVRVKEIGASMYLIQKAFRKMPQGQIHSENTGLPLPQNGIAISIVEGWRGDIVYFVSTDSKGTISRVAPRDPSFINWPVLEHAVLGNIVPDFPLINKSFNLSYSGNDL